MPNNYDGKFRGPMTLRDALGQSINVIAIKLFYLAGLPSSLKTAEDMGISTLGDVGRYGLTLVIGGGEVSLLDMTSAYSVFANDGLRNPYTGILKIEDGSGKILEEFKTATQEVLPKNTALTISDILSDEKIRIPTFGARSALFIPNKDVAVKTGTTNSNKDAWIIGYNPTIAVGVWAGNNDNTPMKKGGAAVAGPIWNKFITEALKTLPDEKFEKPNLDLDPNTVKPILRGSWLGNETFFIDKISGKLATPNTPKETILEKTIANVHSILYWIKRSDITGHPPENPENDSQFNHWEIPVQDWWSKNKSKYRVATIYDKPTATDDIHVDALKPNISIIQPNNYTNYTLDQKITLKILSSGAYPLIKMDVFVNDTYLGTTEAPFVLSFTPSDLGNLEAENELKIVAYDSIYNKSEESIIFRVKQ